MLARGAAALPVSGQRRRAAAKGLHRVNPLKPGVFIWENAQGSAFPTRNPRQGWEPGWVRQNLLPVPRGGEDQGRSDPACPGMGIALPLSDFTQTQGAVRATACVWASPSQHACVPVLAETRLSCRSACWRGNCLPAIVHLGAVLMFLSKAPKQGRREEHGYDLF